MLHRFLMIALVALTVSATPSAAQPPASGQAKPAEPQSPAAVPVPRPEPAGLNANIKLELTITEQAGPAGPLKKVVSMLVADRATGSIRSTGSGRGQVNVDARPAILPNTQSIRLTLGLEYNPRVLGKEALMEWSSLNEQITVVLEAGTPLVISQAADPASDRTITVEVKATILK